MSAALTILEPSEATLLEIATLAADSGVVLVERAGRTALCGAANIPAGWHRVSVGTKEART